MVVYVGLGGATVAAVYGAGAPASASLVTMFCNLVKFFSMDLKPIFLGRIVDKKKLAAVCETDKFKSLGHFNH